MAHAWMLCRIGWLSSDVAAAKALVTSARPRTSGIKDRQGLGSRGGSFAVWLVGASCGAGAVLLFSAMRGRQAAT